MVQDCHFSLELQRFRGSDGKRTKMVQKWYNAHTAQGPVMAFEAVCTTFSTLIPLCTTGNGTKTVQNPGQYGRPHSPNRLSQTLQGVHKSPFVELLLPIYGCQNRLVDRRIRHQAIVVQPRIWSAKTVDATLSLLHGSVRIVQREEYHRVCRDTIPSFGARSVLN